jgi:hypothetical protein
MKLINHFEIERVTDVYKDTDSSILYRVITEDRLINHDLDNEVDAVYEDKVYIEIITESGELDRITDPIAVEELLYKIYNEISI